MTARKRTVFIALVFELFSSVALAKIPPSKASKKIGQSPKAPVLLCEENQRYDICDKGNCEFLIGFELEGGTCHLKLWKWDEVAEKEAKEKKLVNPEIPLDELASMPLPKVLPDQEFILNCLNGAKDKDLLVALVKRDPGGLADLPALKLWKVDLAAKKIESYPKENISCVNMDAGSGDTE